LIQSSWRFNQSIGRPAFSSRLLAGGVAFSKRGLC
jgi:hypothetical protein